MSEIEKNTIEIKSVKNLLEMNLVIPEYQRPYKWSTKNIEDLLNDISNSIKETEKYSNLKYRIGTIILHKDNNENRIVDGQQRVISLILLKKALDEKFEINKIDFKKKLNDKTTQKNIHDNYTYIKEWFSLKETEKEKFEKALENILEVVVITVNNVNEAFQLFDSQNTRGKALDPHALLKAYHLREMKNTPYEMVRAVEKWEAKEPKELRELFNLYLYPIWNWERKIKSKPFTDKDIDVYKGITENSLYTYAKRAGKAMPYFQITESFIAGNDFFEMVSHYLSLLNDIKREIKENTAFEKLNRIIKKGAKKGDEENNEKSEERGVYRGSGFTYAINLFYCALLYYYDKFHNFDKMAVKKLFLWAFMIRLDMEHLGFDTINKYAIGEENSSYTNNIAMFSKISLARLHNEISGIQIKFSEKEWNNLHNELNEIISGENNDK